MDCLDDRAVEHLCKLLGMLGSAHDGEIAAAGRKAHEFLKSHGLEWRDVIAPALTAPQPPHWRQMLAACDEARAHLSYKERAFIDTLQDWRGTPTEKQLAWLTHIYENLP